MKEEQQLKKEINAAEVPETPENLDAEMLEKVDALIAELNPPKLDFEKMKELGFLDTVWYDYVFTAKENEEHKKQLLTSLETKSNLENRKKEAMSDFKAKIEAEESSIKFLMPKLSTGTEQRTKKCRVFLDFERKLRLYVDEDMCVMDEKPFLHGDKQLCLDFSKNGGAKKENDVVNETVEAVADEPMTLEVKNGVAQPRNFD